LSIISEDQGSITARTGHQRKTQVYDMQPYLFFVSREDAIFPVT